MNCYGFLSFHVLSEKPDAMSALQESAETFSFRVDKAWRQRCSQRFRNILDMIAKKVAAPVGWGLLTG